ncbi:APC membrane recruitment 2-like protein [Labeo rohita]|uniref:APC membrane recruitment 2-like protein n=1 Tax=Labeo rohita TaxID=84645 RepID=A0A498NLC0_LABRO|nr:APC membrane recruitment 2-like protein [Labeo rohita]RXN32589.1 APC membrane recruitment 2-like protein [Labeo rohita]
MDAQSESCEPPPCDPQPPGKIRKAFKLFGKRKPGSSVASIFSIRGKGDGGPKSPPSRSKTLDGLNEPTAPEAEAEQVDLDQEEESQQDDAPIEEFTGGNMNLETTPTRQSISSLTSAKSLSFLNMLRKGRRGLMGERQAQTESQRPGRQRKGLKGLFGTVRWRGKEKDDEEEGEPGPPLLASRSNSVEIIKESLTLTPGPPPRSVEGAEEKPQLPTPQEGPTSSEDSLKVSGATKPPPNERLSTLLGDISSILSFDSLTACGDIVADVEAEWVKASSRMEGAPGTLKVDNSEKTSSSTTSTRSRPSPSPTSTLSPTTSFKPSPTLATKPTPSPTTTKPIPSPLTKPAVTSISSPVAKMSPSMPTDPIIPTPTSSPLAKPTPMPSAMPPTPQATATATTTPVIQPTPSPTSVSTQPAPSPTSSPTTKSTTSPAIPAPSPKSSPEIKPDTTALMTKPIPTSTPIPPPISAPTSEAPEPAAVTKTEPAPTPVPKPTQAPTPATKPITHESKHTTSTSATKYTPYPPLFGKPTPAPAPTPRPKLVTTFGLSTSRNTAPISKLETKQPTGQTSKSSTQTSVRKASISESTAPLAKPPVLTSSSATAKSPTVTSAPQVPFLKSPSGITPSFISSKRSDDDARIDSREDLVRQEGTDNRDSISKVVKSRPAAKPTTLSKIPVSGGGRPPKLHHRDSQPNGDEDHSNLTTPVHEEESPFTISRESSSKEALSDVSTESGAVTPTLSHSQEDIVDGKLAARPTAGATRESKIPIKHGSTATYHSVQGRAEATRSKIPVSKMPVRRTSNKPAPTATAAVTRK